MKKKLGIMFILLLIISILILYKPNKVQAKNGICQMDVKYYFFEAEIASSYTSTPEGSKNVPTTINVKNLAEHGEFTMTNFNVKSISTDITGKELEAYVNALAEREEKYDWDNEKEDAPAYCNSNTCLNSGDNVIGFVDITVDDIVEAGGYDAFVNKYMVQDRKNSKKSEGSITNKGVSEDGTSVDLVVNRNWEINKKNRFDGFLADNGENYLFFPIVATVQIDYPCEEEEETIELCPSVNDTGGGIDAGCGGGSSSSKQVHGLDGSANKYTISMASIEHDSIDAADIAVCSGSTTPSYEYGTAKGTFEQVGSLSVGLTPNFDGYASDNYAGGGLIFNFGYEVRAEWDYCVDNPEAKSEYQCIIKTWDAFCESASAQGREEVDLIKDGSNYVCLYYDEETDYDEKSIPASGNCSELGKGWEKSGNQCRKEDGTKKVNKLTTSPKCAPVTLTVEEDKCVDSSAAESTIYKAAAGYYSGIKETSKDVVARDSNDEDDKSMHSIDDKAGTLSGSSQGTGGEWAPNDPLHGNVGYTQYRACINIYTADVRYEQISNKNGNTVSSSNLDENGNAKSVCGQDEIDGGMLYYMPLRLKDKESFEMGASYTNASLLAGIDWTISGSCSINANQKLYGANKYIYRPIDMSKPVPETIENLKTTSVFPKREPGLNWIYFMKDINAINSKLNRNTPEYSVTLTNNDIINIKKYNKNSNYDYPAFNGNVISDSGQSKILKEEFGIENLVGVDNYNDLGKCEKDCW